MDKYRREDDTNDDLGVYNQDDSFDATSSRPMLNSYVVGKAYTDGDFKDRMQTAQSKLSPQEQVLMRFIILGLSIRKASKKMNISQQMASKYWKRIREKLQ